MNQIEFMKSYEIIEKNKTMTSSWVLFVSVRFQTRNFSGQCAVVVYFLGGHVRVLWVSSNQTGQRTRLTLML